MRPILVSDFPGLPTDPADLTQIGTSELYSALPELTGNAIGILPVELVRLAANADYELFKLGLKDRECAGFEMTITPAIPRGRGIRRRQVAIYTIRRVRIGWKLTAVEHRPATPGKRFKVVWRAPYQKIALAQKRATAFITPVVTGY